MAYRLAYSDYPGTAVGPPDPERWVGPQGPPGPAGPVGPIGPAGGGYTLPTASTTILGGVKIDGSTINISGAGVISVPASGVVSFNSRTGAVVLASLDVTNALTFTPYNATNPAGYVNAAGAAAAAPVQSVAGHTGTVTLAHTDITDWTATLAPYAPLASPPLTGTPTAPTVAATASAGTTQLATTAFVRNGTTTNDNALAGQIGEYLSTSGGGAVASGVVANIAAITLTPGDWDVDAYFTTTPAAGTVVAQVIAAYSTTSATLGTVVTMMTITFPAGGQLVLPMTTQRYNVSVSTVLYAVIDMVFSGGTLSVNGVMRARRVR
jgi:hypothetical protein